MIMRAPLRSEGREVIGRDISKASTFRQFMTAEEEQLFRHVVDRRRASALLLPQLPHLPLIIMVAEAEPDIYAAWHRRALTIGSLMSAFAVGLVSAVVRVGHTNCSVGCALNRNCNCSRERTVLTGFA